MIARNREICYSVFHEIPIPPDPLFELLLLLSCHAFPKPREPDGHWGIERDVGVDPFDDAEGLTLRLVVQAGLLDVRADGFGYVVQFVSLSAAQKGEHALDNFLGEREQLKHPNGFKLNRYFCNRHNPMF